MIHAGRYNARGRWLSLRRSGRPGRPIAWTAARGARPVLRGHVEVLGSRRRLCGLVFAGPTGPVEPANTDGERDKLVIRGDRVVLRDSEVRGSRWHSGVFVAGVRGVKLIRNHIHRNGRFGDPTHANLDHGVYWASGSGLVQGNLIERNLALGIQLYPRARGVTVRGNRIIGQGKAGVMIATAASRNVVERNVIYGNERGVEAWQLTGRGNVVRRNRVWGNPGGDLVGLERVRVAGNRQR